MKTSAISCPRLSVSGKVGSRQPSILIPCLGNLPFSCTGSFPAGFHSHLLVSGRVSLLIKLARHTYLPSSFPPPFLACMLARTALSPPVLSDAGLHVCIILAVRTVRMHHTCPVTSLTSSSLQSLFFGFHNLNPSFQKRKDSRINARLCHGWQTTLRVLPFLQHSSCTCGEAQPGLCQQFSLPEDT